MSDSRLVQGSLEAERVHNTTVDRLTSGEDELVSMGSPSEAFGECSLDHCQSGTIANRNLIRRQWVMVKRHSGMRPQRE
jgi:hypothetical protein